jgi:hypothetical protein
LVGRVGLLLPWEFYSTDFPGLVNRKLIELLSALGYHDLLLYTDTTLPLQGHTYAWEELVTIYEKATSDGIL